MLKNVMNVKNMNRNVVQIVRQGKTYSLADKTIYYIGNLVGC